MSRKKRLYHESKNFFISRKLYELHSKPFLRTKTSFARAFPCWFQKTPIFTNQKSCFYPNFFLFPPKTFFFCPLPIPTALNLLSAKISHFYKPKAFYSHKPFLLPPKANLFCPPLPIPTALNLLFAKNTAVLFISALTPCAVKPEPRTDSNHCRRYPAKLQLFTKPVT